MAKNKSTGGDSLKGFAMVGFLLLAVLFGFQIMSFIFGNLGSIDQFEDDKTTIVNETINMADGIGTGSINENTNANFVSWNATTLINRTLGLAGDLGNETLVEGTDYQIFISNGTIGNLTEWNTSLVTYNTVRKPEVQLTSEKITNSSLSAINNYSEQSGTQFTTLGIAITLVILVLVFAFFWKAFMGGKNIGDTGGASNFS